MFDSLTELVRAVTEFLKGLKQMTWKGVIALGLIVALLALIVTGLGS